MVKAKDSTTQKKPSARKATTKPRGKKALLPPQLARSASIQGRYDVAQGHAPPSDTQDNDVSTSSNPTNTTSPTSVHHDPPSTASVLPTHASNTNRADVPLSQDVRLPRIVLLVGQDGNTNSKNATSKGYSPLRETQNSDETFQPVDGGKEIVVDFSKNSAANQQEKAVESGATEKSVRFCDDAGDGERGKEIAWEAREASPVIESTSSQSSKLKRKASLDVSDSNRTASAESKRRKGKAKAQEPATIDDRPLYQYLQRPPMSAIPSQADRVYVQQAYNMNFPMVQHYTAPCLYQSATPPWHRSGTPQAFGGMAYAGSGYPPAQALPTQFSFQYPPPATSSLPFSTPASVPYKYQQSMPYSRASSVTSAHGQPPPYTYDYAPSTLRHDTATTPAGSSRPHSSMAQSFPASNSSSSTCVSRQSRQSFNGAKHRYEAIPEPVPVQQQALVSIPSQPSDSNIDPALRDDPPTYAAAPSASERLVKIEPFERIATAQIGPPFAPPTAAPPTFILPPGVSLLDYLIHRISPLSTEESMDFAFYFACCWDGGEAMIGSTCALYQQWVSASLQGTENLTAHFTRNRQLIQTHIDYFHTHRKDRLTFNPANRKCDNCYGNSPTLPLPTKGKPTGKPNRRCKDCREALLALGEDEMLFKTYTLRRRQVVAIHEEGVRKQLRDMGFPVGGRE